MSSGAFSISHRSIPSPLTHTHTINMQFICLVVLNEWISASLLLQVVHQTLASKEKEGEMLHVQLAGREGERVAASWLLSFLCCCTFLVKHEHRCNIHEMVERLNRICRISGGKSVPVFHVDYTGKVFLVHKANTHQLSSALYALSRHSVQVFDWQSERERESCLRSFATSLHDRSCTLVMNRAHVVSFTLSLS